MVVEGVASLRTRRTEPNRHTSTSCDYIFYFYRAIANPRRPFPKSLRLDMISFFFMMMNYCTSFDEAILYYTNYTAVSRFGSLSSVRPPPARPG